MKIRKRRPALVEPSDAARNREVRQEIDAFLQALSSYPDRFAREPYLSFEQHLFSITAESNSAAERRKAQSRQLM